MSLEEHVLKEWSISIDIFMFFSSLEVIVLILGGKVMTFVFYPLLGSQGIVKAGIRQNNLRLKVLLCDQCQINWNENLGNCDSFTSAVISRICGA